MIVEPLRVVRATSSLIRVHTRLFAKPDSECKNTLSACLHARIEALDCKRSTHTCSADRLAAEFVSTLIVAAAAAAAVAVAADCSLSTDTRVTSRANAIIAPTMVRMRDDGPRVEDAIVANCESLVGVELLGAVTFDTEARIALAKLISDLLRST